MQRGDDRLLPPIDPTPLVAMFDNMPEPAYPL